jgi:ATP-binding cassette subfamily C protein CydC
MKELLYLLKMMIVEKKQILLAVLLGVVAAIGSIGLMGTGGHLISQAALHPPLHALTLTIVTVRFFGLARAGSRYLERYVSHRATFSILGRLRVFFYDKIEPLAPALFMNYRSGDLLSRVIADVEILQYFFLRVVYPPLVMIFVFLATGYLLMMFSWKLAVVLMIGLLLVGLLVPVVIFYLTKNNGYQLRQKRAEFLDRTTEFMFGFVDLKMNGQLNKRVNEIDATSDSLIIAQNRNSIIAAAGESVALVGSFLTTWIVLLLGVILVEADQINGVFLALLVLATITVFETAIPIASMPTHIDESRVAAKRLFAITDSNSAELVSENMDNNMLDNIVSDKDGEEAALTVLENIKREQAKVMLQEAINIEFRNVTFSYPNAQRLALRKINLTISPGKKVAIIGPSGSGKSSILNLLLKFYTSFKGQIYLGEKEIGQYSDEDARLLFGVVAQANHFFNATVRANLLLANRDASDEELLKVLHQVSLGHIQLDEVISEKGISLSGGERQRLAIARMLLKNAPLLLLDEPTTGLDALTEKEVLSTLWSVINNKTVIYITHRLVGLEKMDEIIVVNKGTIIEQGNYSELLDKRGYFYQLKQLETETII